MRIGITAGDPAGIGLEVALKAVSAVLDQAQWILFANPGDFRSGRERFSRVIDGAALDAALASGALRLSSIEAGEGPAEWGRGTMETGRRALAALESASAAALAGGIDAIVTAPLSKRLVGEAFRGQTEYLAGRAAVRRVAMSFFTPGFKVVLATNHLPLTEAVASLSEAGYRDLIRLVDTEFRRLGFAAPRIAVAGVNPHAGEGGMFGREDDAILRPAAEAARGEGIDVSGPHPADSVYARAHGGEFDIVIAPYHDQGLIPVKLVAPRAAANVTLGLPYVRTSPDHGTAFDIAGRGVADAGGMETALGVAMDLVRRSSGSR